MSDLSSKSSTDHAAAELAPATKATTGSLLVIFLTVFIDLLGFGMVLPLLPVYAKQFSDGDENTWQSKVMIGLLMASFSAMQFLFAPLWGKLSDRIGRRPVLIVGLVGSAVFYAGFGLAAIAQSIAALFVCRIGAGIAGATIATAQAYIADTTTVQTRSKGMALIGAAFGLGFILGPLLGAAALLLSPPDQLASSPWPGFLAGGLSAIAATLAIAILPESLPPEKRKESKLGDELGSRFHLAAWSDAFSVPTIPAILLTSFISVVSFGGFESTLSLLLDSKIDGGMHLEKYQILFVFAYIGLILTLVQGLIVRRLSTRIPEVYLATIGLLVATTGFVLLSVLPVKTNLTYLLLAAGVEVSGFAMMTPSLAGLISRRCDPTRQGAVLGVSQSVSALARIIGPVLAIPLTKVHYSTPYLLSIALMTVALVMLLSARAGKDFGPAAPSLPITE